MGVVKKVSIPTLYPARSVWGSTGECVDVGDVIPGTAAQGGVRVYLSERESREVLIAWGWPLPEVHAAVVEKAEELEREVEFLRVKLEERAKQKTAADLVAEELARHREEVGIK